MSPPSAEPPRPELAYRRVLLKLSGEAMSGRFEYGIDPEYLQRIAADIGEIKRQGCELALVIGGGNIFRGIRLARAGMDRITGDHIGMLATVMNALSMQNELEQIGFSCRVLSAIDIPQICERYIRRRAMRHIDKGRIVIFAAGTGNPFFTTDTAASLRAIEINADILLKGTQVKGVYDTDPRDNPEARRYQRISYDRMIRDQLAVMDTTAIVMCRDHAINIKIFDLHQAGDLLRVVQGEDVGTLITEKEEPSS